MSIKKDGIMVILSSPSGAGKTTLVKLLSKNKNYYIYCRSGNRSGQACALLAANGFGKLVNLAGGMMAWETANV